MSRRCMYDLPKLLGQFNSGTAQPSHRMDLLALQGIQARKPFFSVAMSRFAQTSNVMSRRHYCRFKWQSIPNARGCNIGEQLGRSRPDDDSSAGSTGGKWSKRIHWGEIGQGKHDFHSRIGWCRPKKQWRACLAAWAW